MRKSRSEAAVCRWDNRAVRHSPLTQLGGVVLSRGPKARMTSQPTPRLDLVPLWSITRLTGLHQLSGARTELGQTPLKTYAC